MFDEIAFRYDFLNRFLSMGIDKGWRKKALKILEPDKPKRLLDVATGTGDFAIMAMDMLKPYNITGVDISEGMLEVGKKKIEKLGLSDRIKMQVGDSEALPFGDNAFDAVTVAFGVRNFADLGMGLSEIHRVLRPNAKLIIAELTTPTMPVVKQIFGFYMNFLTPMFGKLFSNNKKAYSYLNESIKKFPQDEEFVGILKEYGFKNASYKPLTLGTCTIYSAEK